MVEPMPLPNETVTSLAMALVQSSKAPLLLLDDDVVVIGASTSFCNAFNLDPATIANRRLAELGAGEWNVPQLNSLLLATIAGAAEIDAYEMDLVREGKVRYLGRSEAGEATVRRGRSRRSRVELGAEEAVHRALHR